MDDTQNMPMDSEQGELKDYGTLTLGSAATDKLPGLADKQDGDTVTFTIEAVMEGGSFSIKSIDMDESGMPEEDFSGGFNDSETGKDYAGD